MFGLFKVYFLSNVHSCFFYLNDFNLRKHDSKRRAIKIKFGPEHQKMTFGCISLTPLAEVPDDHIGVSSLYGYKLGLKENETIMVTRCDVDSIGSLQILPKKEEDYVILLSCKSILETHLLNQLSVVAEGQILPVYVFSNISIDIEIGKVNLSSGYGQLQKFTEITVLHPSEKPSGLVKAEDQFLSGETEKKKRNLFGLIYNNLNNVLVNKDSLIKMEEQRRQEIIFKVIIEDNKNNFKKLEFKVQPSFMLACDVQKEILSKCVIVSNLDSKNCFGPYCVKIFGKVKKLVSEVAMEKLENSGNNDETLFINTYIISLNNINDYKIAFCPPYVMRKLKLFAGSKITIEQLKHYKSPGKTDESRKMQSDYELPVCFWESIAEIRENVKQTVINNFRYNYRINTLIVGGPGTGKTYMLRDLVNEFTNEFIYSKVIQCKGLRGKKIESLHQLLINNFKDCVYHEPCLLVLEDLHSLTYVAEEGEEEFSRHYSDRIVDLISALLEDLQRLYSIAIVASAVDLPQLAAIVSSRGSRLFQNVLKIPEINLSERSFMLRSIINHKIGIVNDHVYDLEKLSNCTNGYTIQNLSDVVDKAIFNCLLRNDRGNLLDLSQNDFELALSEFVPSNLIGVKLKQNIEVRWDDVGGMIEPKKILTEVFSWPLKYPDLLESCPLRLQRGVLLYGAPGTGKTLLAGALANKCGLNFISVKGPEVLSKYVGASEEGVRSLFVQAQKTQPCLLFFDEFDSLVPKRGHDSSGVTDRVVNQMLTQLDGVESLNGVWVLAATSRPDLLDPALLRPGRLDKLVFCEVPNQIDRLSILEVLSQNLSKAEDVSLLEIAEKTEGYTGADLQAVLYNAQMSAIKDTKNSPEEKSDIEVKRIHCLRAISEVKPSMSQKEKERYGNIYEKFLSSRKKNNSEKYVGVQKVTLA